MVDGTCWPSTVCDQHRPAAFGLSPFVTVRRTGLCPTEHPPRGQNQFLCTDCIHPSKDRERHHARESLQEIFAFQFNHFSSVQNRGALLTLERGFLGADSSAVRGSWEVRSEQTGSQRQLKAVKPECRLPPSARGSPKCSFREVRRSHASPLPPAVLVQHWSSRRAAAGLTARALTSSTGGGEQSGRWRGGGGGRGRPGGGGGDGAGVGRRSAAAVAPRDQPVPPRRAGRQRAPVVVQGLKDEVEELPPLGSRGGHVPALGTGRRRGRGQQQEHDGGQRLAFLRPSHLCGAGRRQRAKAVSSGPGPHPSRPPPMPRQPDPRTPGQGRPRGEPAAAGSAAPTCGHRTAPPLYRGGLGEGY